MFASLFALEAAHCEAERAVALSAETAMLRPVRTRRRRRPAADSIMALRRSSALASCCAASARRLPVNMVLVHNGDDEEVGAAVSAEARRPEMRVVRVPENSGCAGGWNRVLAANPAAPWWLIVNDDIAFRGARCATSRPRCASSPAAGARAEARPLQILVSAGIYRLVCFALSAHAIATSALLTRTSTPCTGKTRTTSGGYTRRASRRSTSRRPRRPRRRGRRGSRAAR